MPVSRGVLREYNVLPMVGAPAKMSSQERACERVVPQSRKVSLGGYVGRLGTSLCASQGGLFFIFPVWNRSLGLVEGWATPLGAPSNPGLAFSSSEP